MRKILYVLLFFVTTLPCFADTYVAVVETVAENDAIGRSERMFLTDKLRERAKKILPTYMGYVIMTRENIQQMLPPGKKIEDCEGECLVETGKNINAHYIAQARVGRFGKSLTLTVELYETMGNNLVGSFTAREADAEGLLEQVEKLADGMFANITVNNRSGQSQGGDGIIGLNMGDDDGYKVEGTKSIIVNISSEPNGAVFSVDGRPVTSCSKTPCDILLKPGSHRFSFGMDMFFDQDTVLDVMDETRRLLVNMEPNFGYFTLDPVLKKGLGNEDGLFMTVDGEKWERGEYHLRPGSYRVEIRHECYNDVNFDVNVKNGSVIRFNRQLIPVLGGLELNAVEDGTPRILPVYVNDSLVGETPFLETVPVCSKIAVGSVREVVDVSLKRNETVSYLYDFGRTSVFKDYRDGQKYKIVTIGSQVWMAQNLNYETGRSWCYADDYTNCKKYGRLYDWKDAVEVCPSGWHLPSSKEFEMLRTFVGGAISGGLALKSTTDWADGNNGVNTSGFKAFPAGFRNYNGNFYDESLRAFFWSSTEYLGRYAYSFSLRNDKDNASLMDDDKDLGFSVRCLKD